MSISWGRNSHPFFVLVYSMDGIVVAVTHSVGKGCRYCRQLNKLDDRRFYSDDSNEPFIIIENLTTLTPILIFCDHVLVSCIEEVLHVYAAINDVCSMLFGDRYYLRPDDSSGHFAILSFRILL